MSADEWVHGSPAPLRAATRQCHKKSAPRSGGAAAHSLLPEALARSGQRLTGTKSAEPKARTPWRRTEHGTEHARNDEEQSKASGFVKVTNLCVISSELSHGSMTLDSDAEFDGAHPARSRLAHIMWHPESIRFLASGGLIAAESASGQYLMLGCRHGCL